MEEGDRVAAACVIPEESSPANGSGENGNGNGQDKLPLE
jgi:hypothetical protein